MRGFICRRQTPSASLRSDPKRMRRWLSTRYTRTRRLRVQDLRPDLTLPLKKGSLGLVWKPTPTVTFVFEAAPAPSGRSAARPHTATIAAAQDAPLIAPTLADRQRYYAGSAVASRAGSGSRR